MWYIIIRILNLKQLMILGVKGGDIFNKVICYVIIVDILLNLVSQTIKLLFL